jgi:hypothetical protein
MKRVFLLAGLFILPLCMLAQYQIKIRANNTKDSIAYFRASLFDDKNYIPKDTIILTKGTQIIKSNKPIIGGIYFFYFPNTKQKISFFLENNDNLEFEFTGVDYLNQIKTNKRKNQVFIQYQQVEKKLSSFDSIYAQDLAKGIKRGTQQKALFFKPKTDSLTIFRNQYIKIFPKIEILPIYFNALNQLDTSIPNKKNYEGRRLFINQFDLNNAKLFFTPAYKQIIVEYFSYYPLEADSIVKGVDTLFSKLLCSNKSYNYVFDYVSKLLKNREIQNNTEGYTYLIERYVKAGKCPFLDATSKETLLKELVQVKAQKVKDTCVNMLLLDTAGVTQNLHSFAKNNNYTVIIFYDPNCEHCKVEVPKMDSIIQVLEQQLLVKIGKYAICNEPKIAKADWGNFIKTNHLTNNYVHVNLGLNMDIRKSYDAFSNPLFFLIDRDAILLAKKLGVNTLRKELIKAFQHYK